MTYMLVAFVLVQLALTGVAQTGCSVGDDANALLQGKTKLDVLNADPSLFSIESKIAARPVTKLLGEVETMAQEVVTSGLSGKNVSAPPVRDMSKVRTIKTIVQDVLMPGLTDAHAFAESQLNEDKEKIDECIQEAHGNLATVKAMNTSTSEAEDNHAACRREEHELANDMKTKCDDLKTFLDSLSLQKPPTDMALDLVWPYLEEQHRLFLILMDKNLSCNTSTEAHTAKKSACDQMQTTFESDFCQYRTKIYDTADAFTICNATTTEAYDNVYKATQAEVPKWKSEYKAVKKIECYLNVWLGDDNISTVNTSSPSSCQDDNIDVSAMDVAYPTIPHSEAGETKSKIDMFIGSVNPYPGIEAFLRRYDDLPTHSDVITECMTYTTTTTTTTTAAGPHGLVYHLKFDHAVTDSMSAVTVTSSSSCSDSNYVSGALSSTGTGYNFSRGSGCYLTVDAPNPSVTTTDWTHAWWFKPDSSATTSGRVDFGYPFPSGSFRASSPMAPHYTYNRNNVENLCGYHTSLCTTTSSFTVGSWYHIAFVRDASTLKVYLDGTVQNTGTTSESASAIETFRFGDFQGTAGYIVDDLAVLDRALDSTEIASLAAK